MLLCVLIENEEEGDVDNDEDYDGSTIWPCLIGGSIASWPLIWRWSSRPERPLEYCMERTHGANLSPNTDGALWELLLLIN